MEKYKFDESNGLWYELVGDYYLPCLTLPEVNTEQIGPWGEQRRKYLQICKKHTYADLFLSGKLEAHLMEVDRHAGEMFDHLVRELAHREGVTEALKAADQMAWIAQMNNIRSRATEIVYQELICA